MTMRLRLGWMLTSLLLWLSAARAVAGITVTSYTTTALTNGFAPSLQGPYLEQQDLVNVSLALAEVSGDWTGPNEDGTPDTWRFVGASRSSSTTTFDENSYTVTAAASFEYTLDTTAAFVDPRPSVFSPGGAANYRGFFENDTDVRYTLSVLLNRRGRVRLSSFAGAEIFDEINLSPTPVILSLSGILPPAQYQILASTSSSAPNLPNGVNLFAASGSFENLTFAVQVPEPNVLGAIVVSVAARLRRRGRCAGTG